MAQFGLPPGIPATILLIIVSIVGVISSIKISNNHTGILDVDGLRWFLTKSPPQVRATVTGLIALPFWIWALCRVVMSGIPDVGVISFLLVMIASVLNIKFINNMNHATCPAYLLLVCNIMLSLNYSLAAILIRDLSFTFYVYLVIGGVYWAFMALWNFKGYLFYVTLAKERNDDENQNVIKTDDYGSLQK